MPRIFILCIALILGGWIHGSSTSGTTYYVSTSGSDSNNGTSPSTPWQTITKVNAASYNPGDRILFNGGQTFSGGIVASSTGSCGGIIQYGSYGTGQATISSGSSIGFFAQNKSGLTVSNLIFTGGGDLSTTVHGIQFDNNSSTTQYNCITVSNNTVSAYGGSGIEVTTSATKGFSNIQIVNNVVHDVTGGYSAVRPGSSGCIYIGLTGTGTESLSNHANAIVNFNTVYNCIGIAGDNISTGNGILLQGVVTGTVGYNIAHDFGASSNSSSEPVGIWAVNSSGITIQFNEVYNGSSGGVAGGDGIDLDGGVTNSLVQYNWIHGNTGPGLLACSFGGAFPTWGPNTYRYNITQTNGREFSICLVDDMLMNVYGNTFYSGTTGTIVQSTLGTATLSGVFANNQFVAGNVAGTAINVAHPGTVTFAGNNYFGESGYHGTFWSWSGATYTTYSSWQTATAQEKVSGSNVGLNANPAFTSPGGGGITGGYNPSALTAYQYPGGSPTEGAGLNLNSVFSISPGAQDYYGTTIPTAHGSGYDMGAYSVP